MGPMARRARFASWWALSWIALLAVPALAGEGPFHRLPRYDLEQTRAIVAKARLDSRPVARWRHFSGGRPAASMAIDVDGDLNQDLLTIESGAVIARRAGGQVIWNTGPIAAVGFLDRPRLTGGVLGIGVRLAKGMAALTTETGEVVFVSPQERTQKPYVATFADVDGDGIDEALTADLGGYSVAVKGVVYVYRVADGQLLAQTPDELPNGEPSNGAVHNIVDVDGDGDADIFGAYRTGPDAGVAYAYDGKTGALLATSAPDEARSCDSAFSVPASDGGAPLVVCVANFSSQAGALAYVGLVAYRLQGKVIERVWSNDLDPAAGDEQPVVVFGDFDADGQWEFLTARKQLGLWSTQAIDAATGKALAGGSAPLRQIAAPGGVMLFGNADGPTGGTAQSTYLGRWSRDKGVQVTWTLTGGPVFVLRADESGLHALLHELDDDGDGAYDRVLVHSVGADLKAKVTAELSMNADPRLMTPLRMASGAAYAVLGERNGSVWVYDEGLLLVGDPDAQPIARIGATPQAAIRSATGLATQTGIRVLVGEPGRVLLLNPANADPSTPPAAETVMEAPGQLVYPIAADLDGDGARELAVRYTDVDNLARISAYELDGSLLWTYVHGDANTRWPAGDGSVWTVADVDADGDEDVVPTWRYVGAEGPAGRRVALDGKTGKPLWKPDAACRTAQAESSALDSKLPGIGLICDYGGTRRCDLATGDLLLSTEANAPRYGYAMLGELDDKAGKDAVLVGGTHGIAALDEALKSIWVELSKAHPQMDAALAPTAEGPRLLVVRDAIDLRCIDPRDGSQLWIARYQAGKRNEAVEGQPGAPLGPPTVVSDLFGDGQVAALFTTSEGRLYAVQVSDGAVRWNLDLGGTIGDLSIGDVDGDGEIELIVASPDGNITCLDRDVLGRPKWVRENAGDGPALSEAEDIDIQEPSDVLHANWDVVVGASGYRARVVGAEGSPITGWVDFGAEVAGTFKNLALIVGRRYKVEVVAYAKGQDAVESLPAVSDGVQVQDQSPPTVISLVCEPAGVSAGQQFLCRLEGSDKTRLQRLSMRATAPDGATELAEATLLTVLLSDTLEMLVGTEGLGEGDIVVDGVVRDVVGNETAAQVSVHVCPAGSVYQAAVNGGGGVCGPDGGTAGADVGSVPDDGCGCSVTRPRAPSAGAFWLLAFLAVVWAAARRKIETLPRK